MNARSLQSVLVLLAQILGPFGQTWVFYKFGWVFYKFTENGEFLNRWFLLLKGKNRDACQGDFVKWRIFHIMNNVSFPFDCLKTPPYIFCILSALITSHDHTYVTDRHTEISRNRQKVRVTSSIIISRESLTGYVKPLQQDFTQPRLQVQDKGKTKSKQVNLLCVERW